MTTLSARDEYSVAIAAGEKLTITSSVSSTGYVDRWRGSTNLGRTDIIESQTHVFGPYLFGMRFNIVCQTGSISFASSDENSEINTQEVFNVQKYGAVGDGVTDDSAAFSAAWAAMIATKTLYGLERYVHISIVIPPGRYYIGSSVNWTDCAAYNLSIFAYGAVIIGDVAGGNIIDMIGVLGAHIMGLTITSGAVNVAKTGLLIGPIGTATCGVNKLSDVKIEGYYSAGPLLNIGSETTKFDNVRLSNFNTVGDSYAYVGDGMNRFGAVSEYQTIRDPNTAASFTENTFNHCSLRNYSTVNNGAAVYIENTVGWSFDKGCYFLAFTGPAVRIRNEANSRNYGLSLKGLFETTLAPGLDHAVEYWVSTGAVTTTEDNELDLTTPHAKTSIIKVSHPTGGVVGDITFYGTIRLRGAYIGSSVPLFDAASLDFVGDIHCVLGGAIDLGNIAGGNGVIYTTDISTLTFPTDITGYNFLIMDKTSGELNTLAKDMVFNCFANAEQSGSLKFSRLPGHADRGSVIEAFNSATEANNYIKLKVHNGTIGARVDALTAKGDGSVSVLGAFGVNGSTPLAKPTITGSRGGNAALADLLTQLASYGFITDGTSA
jgi:hypothetical protein